MHDPTRRLMPHEWVFGALYVWAIIRLAIAPGPHAGWITAWLLMLLVGAATVAVTRRWPTMWGWRVRLGAMLVFLNVAYSLMGPTIRAVGTPLRDVQLQNIDRTIFGAVLPTYLDRFTHPALTEFFSACYFLLFPYILFSVVRYLARPAQDLAITQRFITGLFLVYAVAFIGYTLVPASGPYLAMPSAFHHALTGYAVTRLNDAVILRGTNHVDVYPSLHVAASTFMLVFDRWYARWRFRAYLLPGIGLWIATIYLRYHYGIDVLSGFVLAAIGLFIATRYRPVAPLAPAGLTLGVPRTDDVSAAAV